MPILFLSMYYFAFITWQLHKCAIGLFVSKRTGKDDMIGKEKQNKTKLYKKQNKKHKQNKTRRKTKQK